MTTKLYKTTALAILAGLMISFSSYAQDTKADGKSKEAKEVKEKEMRELRAKQQELRAKQQALNKELLEVNKKLSVDLRNSLFSLHPRHDSILAGLKNSKIYRLDSSFVNALTRHKLAVLDYSKNVRLFDMDKKKYSEDMSVLAKKLAKSNRLNFNTIDPNYKAVEKSKIISRSYPVSSKDKLSVNNQYGTVTINTWNKNEIKVDVEVKAYEASEEKAQELLDGVKIEDAKQNNLVSFKTVISQGRNNTWFFQSKNGVEQRRGVFVNYVVYMPAKSSLDVTNKLGGVVLPDLEGLVNVNVSNGSLKALKLSNAGNHIVVSQGSADIETFDLGNILVSYGSLKIGTANQLTAKVNAGSTRIGTLVSGNLDINMGAFKADALGKNMKDVIINADKSSVALGTGPASNFDFDVTVNLAGFKYDTDRVNMTSKNPLDRVKGYSQSQNYKGQYGKGSDSKVTIKSSYGSVQFL